MKHALTQVDAFSDTPLQAKPLDVVCIEGRLKF